VAAPLNHTPCMAYLWHDCCVPYLNGTMVIISEDIFMHYSFYQDHVVDCVVLREDA